MISAAATCLFVLHHIKAIDAALPSDYEALVSNKYSQSDRLKIAIVGFGNFLSKAFVSEGHLVSAYSRADYLHTANSLGVSFFQNLCEQDPDVLVQ
ncbi:hypothetical protein H5410_005312 [Solanum commersonii]|uniref:Uncharacterized protein n=1 Tax=Solanum commersonii TaxID=4109 RepID=A0A9J6A620_SOLCO|nr:hypothetical protein H5410_005312 [Solanum commersonii]